MQEFTSASVGTIATIIHTSDIAYLPLNIMALSMTSAVLGAGLSAQTFRLKRTSRRSVRLQAPRAEKGLGEQIEEKTKVGQAL
jgi:hypothetical protein